jgi:signal peptidase I
MRNTLKFLCALAVALIAMLAFRALVFTIYTVPGSRLEPAFKAGDRVMVNRWAYGLRTGGGGLFSYGRIGRQTVSRSDWVAYDDSLGRVFIGQCKALPGDTVLLDQRRIVIPGLLNCARHNYYHIGNAGVIREEQIIGRVSMVVYSHRPTLPFWEGYDCARFLLLL